MELWTSNARGPDPGPSESEDALQETLSLVVFLQEEPIQLPRVQEDTLAEPAAIHGDALQDLFDEIVSTLGTLHEMEVLESLPFSGLFQIGALLLPLLSRDTGFLEQLLLVLTEPVVLTPPVDFLQGLLLRFGDRLPPQKASLAVVFEHCQ